MRPRAPAWFVDHDTLGLAHALSELRDGVTFPGDTGERRHGKWRLAPCPVPLRSVRNEVWITRFVGSSDFGVQVRV